MQKKGKVNCFKLPVTDRVALPWTNRDAAFFLGSHFEWEQLALKRICWFWREWDRGDRDGDPRAGTNTC